MWEQVVIFARSILEDRAEVKDAIKLINESEDLTPTQCQKLLSVMQCAQNNTAADNEFELPQHLGIAFGRACGELAPYIAT